MLNILNQELLVALLILLGSIGTNIFMGYLMAEITTKFDYRIFITGVKKGAAIFIGVTAISIAAQYDNTIMFNDVLIVDYVKNIIVLGYIYYFGQVVIKVVKLVGVKALEGNDTDEN